MHNQGIIILFVLCVNPMHWFTTLYIYVYYMVLTYVVLKDPIETTVCEGDIATFKCVVFFPSGTFPTSPGWLRNGTIVGMIRRHTINSNQTGGGAAPISISSTLIVSNVTVVDDNRVSYQCGSGLISSSNATLTVVGK